MGRRIGELKMGKYMETPTSVACGIDVYDEVKRLEEMKKQYAELF